MHYDQTWCVFLDERFITIVTFGKCNNIAQLLLLLLGKCVCLCAAKNVDFNYSKICLYIVVKFEESKNKTQNNITTHTNTHTQREITIHLDETHTKYNKKKLHCLCIACDYSTSIENDSFLRRFRRAPIFSLALPAILF